MKTHHNQTHGMYDIVFFVPVVIIEILEGESEREKKHKTSQTNLKFEVYV